MKKTLCFIAFLFCVVLSAQKKSQLDKLSSAKFLSSNVIVDDNDNEDVYGYISLYETNKADENTFEVLYVLTDKNMNEIVTGKFNQNAYDGPGRIIQPGITWVKKIKDDLYFSVAPSPAFRKLNLKDFSLVGPMQYKDHELSPEPEKKFTLKDWFATSKYEFISTGGVITEISGKGKTPSIKYMDQDFKEKWTFNFDEQGDKKPTSYEYFKADGTDMVFLKKYHKKPKETVAIDLSLQLVDERTGKKRFEIPLKDTQYIYHYEKLFFKKDKLVLVASLFKFDDKREYKLLEKKGYVKVVYDRTSGKELSKDFVKWQDITQEQFNEHGNIKGYGRIHFLDYRLTDDDKLVILGEGHQTGSIAHIMDLHLFVFDSRLKVTDYKRYEKASRILDYPPISGEEIEKKDGFDFMYSQQTAPDTYIYFYQNKVRNKWVLGTITYDGKTFENRIVSLKTSGGKIVPIPAKKGYILFSERAEKGSSASNSLRLEKINY